MAHLYCHYRSTYTEMPFFYGNYQGLPSDEAHHRPRTPCCCLYETEKSPRWSYRASSRCEFHGTAEIARTKVLSYPPSLFMADH